jgi:hypothetical protein
MCGKGLKEAIPVLVEAMERHGHLRLAAEVRPRREGGGSIPLRNSIAVRTFGDWNEPPPGFFEISWPIAERPSPAATFIAWCWPISLQAGPKAPMVMRSRRW